MRWKSGASSLHEETAMFARAMALRRVENRDGSSL